MLSQIPNIISTLRIFLVVPVVWALINGQFELGLLLFAVAGVSDAVDGFLAKRFHWQSRLGGFLDPLADKLLLVCSFLAIGWLGLVPWWLVVLVIVRDLVIVSGAVAYHFTVGRFDAEPTPISKLNTAVQILLVVLVVLDQSLLPMSAWILTTGEVMVAVTTVLSGVNYVIDWSRRAERVEPRRNREQDAQ